MFTKYAVHFNRPKMPVYTFKDDKDLQFILDFSIGVWRGIRSDFETLPNETIIPYRRGFRQGQFVQIYLMRHHISMDKIKDVFVTLYDCKHQILSSTALHNPKAKEQLQKAIDAD
jgi:hypothetical protein